VEKENKKKALTRGALNSRSNLDLVEIQDLKLPTKLGF
jgi:hypothetical protein